jgi:hypothetical protein
MKIQSVAPTSLKNSISSNNLLPENDLGKLVPSIEV